MSTYIAMWSGPRNISTAMMRAWENRPDTVVWDEPLYAHYLQATGLDHPGRDEVIAAGEPDWEKVIACCTGPIPEGKAIFYQKHMTHHLLPEIQRDWLDQLSNVFLIRDPRRVLASYVKSRETVTLEDIGLPQQVEIFEHVKARGESPLIIDSADFLYNPRGYLQALCAKLGLEFSERMLHWPAGPRESDGVWAKYWYATVQQSTGFTSYQERPLELTSELHAIAEQAAPYYQTLHAARLCL